MLFWNLKNQVSYVIITDSIQQLNAYKGFGMENFIVGPLAKLDRYKITTDFFCLVLV